MPEPTVLVTEPIDQAGMDILAAAPVQLECGWQLSAAELPAVMQRCNALVVRIEQIDAAKMRTAPNLQLISRHGVGCDNIDLPYAKERGITVAITAHANYASVAEHVLAMLLSLAKDLPGMDRAARGDYANPDAYHAVDIAGRTILVLGYGRIGAQVAKLCSGCGMRVIVHDVMLAAGTDEVDGFAVVHDLDEGLRRADVLTVHVPRNERTMNMISTRQLELMKPGGYVINCARGGIVDEQALADAAASGRLAGVAADVFSVEPVAADNPLLGVKNCVLSPHAASLSVECMRKMAEQCAQNAVDFFAGKLPAHNVFKL